MVWTAPMTFTDGTTLTAAQLNIYLRDNLNECAPAKATTGGYHFVSTGAGIIAERAIKSSFTASTNTTTSTSYVTITNAPQVTATTGAGVIACISATQSNTLSSTSTFSSIAVTGATEIAADASRCFYTDGLGAAQAIRASAITHITGLTAGSNTFTMQNAVSAGTGSWVNRQLLIIAL